MTKEHGKAFVIPHRHYKGHLCCYNFDHHVVHVTDSNGHLLENHEALRDTAEAAGDWALDQNYQTFIQKPELVRNGVRPDPKDPSQWVQYKEGDRKKNNRKTLKDFA